VCVCARQEVRAGVCVRGVVCGVQWSAFAQRHEVAQVARSRCPDVKKRLACEEMRQKCSVVGGAVLLFKWRRQEVDSGGMA